MTRYHHYCYSVNTAFTITNHCCSRAAFGLEVAKSPSPSFLIMIYDVEAPSWWKLVIPHKDGKPVKVYYHHKARDWNLVIDPFDQRKFYWADCSNRVWRTTPLPFDKDAECQTGSGLFLPEAPAQPDVWASLGSSVANLSCEQQSMIYDRLVRFLELGWFN